MTQFYVYKLIDPKTRKPFYIGKGSGDRMIHHELYHTKNYKTSSHNNTLLKNKIAKVLRESEQIRYQQYFCKNEQQAFSIETALISKYGRRNNKTGILCNMTEGGEGVSGHVRNEQWKEKHRIAAKKRRRKINQYTKKGQFICTWKDYHEILNNVPTTDSSGLSRCCNNKIKSCGGYRWTYFGEQLQKWSPIYKDRDPHKSYKSQNFIYQFTQEGNFIMKHFSLVAAGQTIKKHANTILECCKKRSRHAGGFVWRYQNNFKGYQQTIFQYDGDTGKFIQGFCNIRSASLQTGLTQLQIRNSLHKKNSKGGQFYWKFTKTTKIVPHIKRTTGKPVNQFTRDMQFIQTFNSVRQAINQTNIKGIPNCVINRSKTAGGFVWKYQ